MGYQQMAFGPSGDLVKLKEDTRSAIEALGDYRREISMTLHATQMLVSMFRNMDLPPEMRKGLAILYNFIRTARLLRMEMQLLRTAMGPIGWALMGATLLAGAIQTSQDVIKVEQDTH